MTESHCPCYWHCEDIWRSRSHRSDVKVKDIEKQPLMSFSLLLSFQSVHLFIWAAIFSGVHLSSLYPPTLFSGCFCFTSIGPWREGSVKPVHSLLIKSSFVSSLPRTVFLPIRKKSLWWTESRSVQEAPPLCLSSNQTSPVLMLSAFLSLCFFFSFFLSAISYCARARTSSRPSMCPTSRLLGALR